MTPNTAISHMIIIRDSGLIMNSMASYVWSFGGMLSEEKEGENLAIGWTKPCIDIFVTLKPF